MNTDQLVSMSMREAGALIREIQVKARDDVLAALAAGVAQARALALAAEFEAGAAMFRAEAADNEAVAAELRPKLPPLQEVLDAALSAKRRAGNAEMDEAADRACKLAQSRLDEVQIPLRRAERHSQQAAGRAGSLTRLAAALRTLPAPDSAILRQVSDTKGGRQ